MLFYKAAQFHGLQVILVGLSLWCLAELGHQSEQKVVADSAKSCDLELVFDLQRLRFLGRRGLRCWTVPRGLLVLSLFGHVCTSFVAGSLSPCLFYNQTFKYIV